ncbi:DUF4376 domain-containing protein [Roseospira visakhapatnamensis]|uniref:DUF4376 domain-containing protein n=1 Tax=Roseospira visakhapatnamensis TaxID=390880 RepID=A0A7W6WAE6_9PROT|nr:DUF4376 domain-containing protein [Roseospira visakhapatnamensis]MBB4266884.1 hypothetical protein [Roseospira visakhapatnamensis]
MPESMWARIDDNGRVAELIRHDPAGAYHPSITWVSVPEALRPWVRTHGWRVTDDGQGVEPDSLDALVAQAAARVAAERWTRQTAGVMHDGHRYHTDTEGRQSITGAVVGAQAHEATHGPGTFSTVWKTADGFVDLDLPGLIAAGQAVLAHVAACFAREAEIRAAIQAAAADPDATATDIITTHDTHIGHGWPGTEET